VALDPELLLLLADPREVEEGLHVASPEKDHAAEDGQRDRQDRSGPPARLPRDERADDAAREQPDRARERAGDEQADGARDAGGPRDPPVDPPGGQRD